MSKNNFPAPKTSVVAHVNPTKHIAVDEIKQNLSKAQAFFIFSCPEMTANQMNKLRQQLKQNAAILKVYKNTLLWLSMNQTMTVPTTVRSLLTRENRIIFVQNITDNAAFYNLQRFCQQNFLELKIKFGYYEKTFYPDALINRLLTIPNREALYQTLILQLKFSMIKLVSVLSSLAQAKTQ